MAILGFDWRDAFGVVHTGGKLVLSIFGVGAVAQPLEQYEAKQGVLPDWANPTGIKPDKAPDEPAPGPVTVVAAPKLDTAFWLEKMQERRAMEQGASRVDILRAKADTAGRMRDQLATLHGRAIMGYLGADAAPAPAPPKVVITSTPSAFKATPIVDAPPLAFTPAQLRDLDRPLTPDEQKIVDAWQIAQANAMQAKEEAPYVDPATGRLKTVSVNYVSEPAAAKKPAQGVNWMAWGGGGLLAVAAAAGAVMLARRGRR